MAMFDRAWLPDLAAERRFDWTLGHSTAVSRRSSVPAGFPESIDEEMVWTGAKFQERPDLYRLVLKEKHIEELENAAAEVEAQGLRIEQICPETFRLATLGPVLDRLAHEIADGRGFFALRGLEPTRYSKFQNVVLYVGIASYIGNRCGRQDEYGNMLLHLTDLGSSAAPDQERQAPYSSVGQPFHTDTGSILGLYALEKAAYGGQSKIVSSWHIYNQLRRIRPDLVRALADSDWVFDSFGQDPPYKTRPLIHAEAGKVVFSFSRRPLLGSATSPRSRNIPDLSNRQVEALNMVQLLADEHALVLDLEAGDMLFWNNLGLLHARNGFTDSSRHRRHLLRIWLHNDKLGWPVPQQIRPPWDEAFEENGRQASWPLEPITDRSYINTQQRQSGHG